MVRAAQGQQAKPVAHVVWDSSLERPAQCPGPGPHLSELRPRSIRCGAKVCGHRGGGRMDIPLRALTHRR